MPISRRAILLSVGAAVGPAPYVRSAESSHVDMARGYVHQLLATNPIPASSFAVMRGPDLLWAEAFGKVNIELDVAATPAHRFRLGSVSKVITATLTAVLAARGIVDLDAPIVQYMPDLPQPHHATTLQQLLTHRGGIRHYLPKDEARTEPGPIDLRLYPRTADVLAVFINDPLVARPGERVSYSTFGYTLASLVVEAAAKAPFLDLVQREIAKPLGLDSLGGDTQIALVPNRVTGYHPGDTVRKAQPDFPGAYGNVPPANVAYKWAGGGLLATATDLAQASAALAPRGWTARRAREPRRVSKREAVNCIRDECDRHSREYHGVQRADRGRVRLDPCPALVIASFASRLAGNPLQITQSDCLAKRLL